MASYVVKGYTTPAGVGDSNSVRQIQQQLVDAGYDVGKTGADGVWGKNTQAAYQQYQYNNMLQSVQNQAQKLQDAYAQASEQFAAAQNAAYASQKAELRAQAERLAQEAEQNRTRAYAGSRLNAIGNNEIMASMGLAGNLYGDARSGASETSRLNTDIAMRNNINAVNTQEMTDQQAIDLAIAQAARSRDASVAQFNAQNSIAQAQAVQGAQQQDFQNALTLMQMQQKQSSGGGSSSKNKTSSLISGLMAEGYSAGAADDRAAAGKALQSLLNAAGGTSAKTVSTIKSAGYSDSDIKNAVSQLTNIMRGK